MFRYLAEKSVRKRSYQLQRNSYRYCKTIRKISMIDAVKKYAGVDFAEVKTDEEAKALT